MSEPYALGDEEFAAVSQLEGRGRFEHLLKRICDTERVFLLGNRDELVVLRDEASEVPPQLPVWPHPRYAEAYRRDRGGGAGVTEIGLDELVDDLLPRLAGDGADVATMPTAADGPVTTVAADELRRAIVSFRQEWYGDSPGARE